MSPQKLPLDKYVVKKLLGAMSQEIAELVGVSQQDLIEDALAESHGSALPVPARQVRPERAATQNEGPDPFVLKKLAYDFAKDCTEMQRMDIPRRQHLKQSLATYKGAALFSFKKLMTEAVKYPRQYQQISNYAEAMMLLAGKEDISAFAAIKFDPHNHHHVQLANCLEHPPVPDGDRFRTELILSRAYYKAMALEYFARAMLERAKRSPGI